MNETKLRPELPSLIPRIAKLPVDERGYPIPFFVAYIDGKPDFRIADAAKFASAVKFRLCWVCGQPLGVHISFVIGPMCAVTRTTAEPATHLDCALWSLRGCPFMMRPKMVRREGGNLDGAEAFEPGGIMIKRNPGVMCLWNTRIWTMFRDNQGRPLLRVGEPESVSWWREGRQASRAEVMEGISSGLPKLKELCDSKEEESELLRRVEAVMPWLPAEELSERK
jgi:hypothetical protein